VKERKSLSDQLREVADKLPHHEEPHTDPGNSDDPADDYVDASKVRDLWYGQNMRVGEGDD
jgi:hypothetical protein